MITYNRRLNVLSALQDKQKAKNIIKYLAELLEKPSVDLFGRVFRDHVKETAKVKKECKEIYRRERPEQNKRHFSKGLSFSKQDELQFGTFTKKFDYQRQSGGSQGYKNRRFPDKKIQQKGNFLQQKHSSAKKTQQERNLYQGNCSSTNFRCKFTRNSSITPVKGCIPIGAKLEKSVIFLQQEDCNIL